MRVTAADVGWFVCGALIGMAFALMTVGIWQHIAVR